MIELNLGDSPGRMVGLTQTRIGRRAPGAGRSAVRRAVQQQVAAAAEPDVAWAVPGFLPSRGSTILHCATFHPRTVRERVEAAQRQLGGGRGFIGHGEARVLSSEFDRASVIRVESADVANDLAARGVALERIVHERPGVDLDRFRPGPKAESLQVAFIGTFSVWKGVGTLVQLADKLRGIAEVHTIGGPVDPFTRKLTAAAPFVPTTDLLGLLSASHALVLPSVTDGFGYVVLEAMASGTVPFVTPEVGASELVRELSGELVLPYESFADAVPDLLRSLPLANLGLRARELAEAYPVREQSARAMRAALDRLNLFRRP